ncbi:MAG TPA: 4-(cytidine 5'-diphospho)-2-C-methyl-D-erythritol kinase [Gemmatimonadales bacterium]|nr:4-(cytidine 5'-diphospho)-2-C-methyl-D-erythritol kinase [Gemmatimonadales bacterium]
MPSDRLAIAAHAKANLFLRILARETTGYHTLETLFTLLELADEVIVERRPQGITLESPGAELGPVEENLAYRAAEMVLAATGRRFGVAIELTKRIPVSAGLGGGSSDGAATLHAVNALAGNAVPRHELLQFAARLGSDVPFLASGAALALAWGRGERMMRLAPPPAAPTLLVLPKFGVNTKKAYDLLDHGRTESETPRGTIVLDDEAFATWGGIGRLGGNDFEVPIFGKEPALRTLFERVAGTRPLLARMTGSGSAVIGIYRTAADRDAAALEIGGKDTNLIPTETRAAPAPAPRTL